MDVVIEPFVGIHDRGLGQKLFADAVFPSFEPIVKPMK